MAPIKAPTKQAVRDYMQSRGVAKTPPATPADIRRQLGWGLAETAAAEVAR